VDDCAESAEQWGRVGPVGEDGDVVGQVTHGRGHLPGAVPDGSEPFEHHHIAQNTAVVLTQASAPPGNPASSRMAPNSSATATAILPFDPCGAAGRW